MVSGDVPHLLVRSSKRSDALRRVLERALVHSGGGGVPSGWMVYFMENPTIKWIKIDDN